MRLKGLSWHHAVVAIVCVLLLAVIYLTSANISNRVGMLAEESTDTRRSEAFGLLSNYGRMRELSRIDLTEDDNRIGEFIIPIQGFIRNVESLSSERFETLMAEQDLIGAVTTLSMLVERLREFLSGERQTVDPAVFAQIQSAAIPVYRVAHAVNAEEVRIIIARTERLKAMKDTILWLAAIFIMFGALFIGSSINKNRGLMAKTRALEASEKKLRDLSFFRQQFLANMSHEFRTPLNAIQGFSDIIIFQRDTITPEKTMEYIEIIQKSAKDLTKLTEDVLDMSKIDAGKFDLSVEDVNFTQLIDDAVVQFRAIAEHRDLRIETAIAAHWLVSCDRMAVKRCITNLLSNAVKFSNPGGLITVRAYLRNAKVFVVEVRDQGMGIPERDLQSIWLVYSRSSLTRRSGVEGAGLGLALVKALMDEHNGFVELQSREGVGTSVRLCFPTSMIVANRARQLLPAERRKPVALPTGKTA